MEYSTWHLIWQTSHLHTSACVSSTFTKCKCNILLPCEGSDVGNFEKSWLLITIFQRSLHFSYPYLSSSWISTRKKNICQVRTSCWVFCWTLVSFPIIHFHTSIVQWNCVLPWIKIMFCLFFHSSTVGHSVGGGWCQQEVWDRRNMQVGIWGCEISH